MNYASYAAFRTAVQTLIDGDDISQSDLSVSTLDTIIGLGEQRIYRDVRCQDMDTTLSLTTTSNAITLPTDFIELHGPPYVANHVAAIYSPWEALQNMQQIVGTTAASPYFYTFQGQTIIFWPALADTTAVVGRYYKRFTDISGGLNAFFNRYPDLFLYAALAESGPFLGDPRTQVWEQKYQALATAVNETERRRVTRGSKLQTRMA